MIIFGLTQNNEYKGFGSAFSQDEVDLLFPGATQTLISVADDKFDGCQSVIGYLQCTIVEGRTPGDDEYVFTLDDCTLTAEGARLLSGVS